MAKKHAHSLWKETGVARDGCYGFFMRRSL